LSGGKSKRPKEGYLPEEGGGKEEAIERKFALAHSNALYTLIEGNPAPDWEGRKLVSLLTRDE